jgi:2-octaprenyl-6-methoxyphenol hydroxylase
MAQTEAFDVVIAGAGMTGATLALALAKAGLAVAVVDAQPMGAGAAEAAGAPFDGRASAIAAASMNQWRALGIAGALEAGAEPIRSILITDGRAPGAAQAHRMGRGAGLGLLRFDSADLGETDPEAPLGYMVENRRIRAVLAAAIETAGVSVFAPAAVRTAQTGCSAATVTLTDGRMLTAPLVVGAEGRRSAVREAAGVKIFGWGYPQTGIVATVSLSAPHQGVAHEYFLPNGPLAILPLTEDRASLVWTEKTTLAGALGNGSPEAFEAHLARRFGDYLGRPRLVGPRFTFPLSLQMAEAIIAPRTALVGDAAHAIHPIAGQGLNLGLKDVAALAEVIVEARRLGEDWGAALTLDRYARWRRFDAVALAAATDLFTRLFSNDLPILRAARGAGLALVDRIGPARRFFVREAAGSLGDRPRLLRGEAL